MIPLPKETIDNIFEPRRQFSFAERGNGSTMRNRLLTDGKNNYYTVAKVNGEWEWYELSRKAPEWGLIDSWRGKWGHKKGTYPAWMQMANAKQASIPNELFECLPGPIHQCEILLAFYRIAFPRFDQIVKMENWPRVSKATWTYIFQRFSEFDRRMHPDVLPGGAWGLGSGFSGNDRAGDAMPDWKIDVSEVRIAYDYTPFQFRITETRYGDDDEYSRFRPYIEWDVMLAPPWEGQRMGDSLDPSHESRPDNLAEAQAQCEKRAGCSLAWSEVPPERPEFVAAEWRSQWVRPEREMSRAA